MNPGALALLEKLPEVKGLIDAVQWRAAKFFKEEIEMLAEDIPKTKGLAHANLIFGSSQKGIAALAQFAFLEAINKELNRVHCESLERGTGL